MGDTGQIRGSPPDIRAMARSGRLTGPTGRWRPATSRRTSSSCRKRMPRLSPSTAGAVLRPVRCLRFRSRAIRPCPRPAMGSTFATICRATGLSRWRLQRGVRHRRADARTAILQVSQPDVICTSEQMHFASRHGRVGYTCPCMRIWPRPDRISAECLQC